MAETKMTAARRRWLQRLVDEGRIASRATCGQTAYHCMRAGWSEWVYRREDTGEVWGEAELDALYSNLWRGPDSDKFRIIGEQITEAGRAALSAATDGEVGS
jgi:hypothetical protein